MHLCCWKALRKIADVVLSIGVRITRNDSKRLTSRSRGLICEETSSRRTSRLLARTTAWLSWGYLVAVVATWALLHFGGDRWWFATVVLFGPRWLVGVPLLLLIPAAGIVRRRLLWPLSLATLLLVFPVLGLNLPWRSLLSSADGPTLRVMTCNTNGGHLDAGALTILISDTHPDVVMLQEFNTEARVAWPAGWNVRRAGQLLVASRYPIDSVANSQRSHPASPWPPVNALYVVLRLPCGTAGVCCVHLMTPRSGLSEILDRRTVINPSRSQQLSAEIAYRRAESQELREWLDRFTEPLVIAGDFNMPADSGIFQDYWAGEIDAFSVTGVGLGQSKLEPLWKLGYGVRIDHILTGNDWTPVRCWLGPSVGSDHLPVIADIARQSGHRNAN